MNIPFYNWILLTGIGITLLIILFILFPSYFYLIALIIIFGALLVFFVGESSYKSHLEKKRVNFLLAIKPIISNNIELSKLNIQIIKDKLAGGKLEPLEKFLESRDSKIKRMGFDKEISRDLLVLKESIDEINKNVSEINSLKVKFNNIEDSTKFTTLIAQIVSFEDNLDHKLSEFIKNSQKMSIRIEKLISD